jgi:PAS domain S-box-containing protein
VMKKINILLVDDRPEGLVTLEAVLANPEYRLIKAGSGREALSHVLADELAVILMDVHMPGMDGFETATIIKQRERSRNIPIIFMTANNKADNYISIGYSLGAVDYVLKPFDAHVLRSKVAVFVDLYKKTLLIKEQAETLREVEKRDRMRTLHELEMEGRRRYQNLADAIPQIVFRANVVGEVDYFNQFWQQYTGKNLAESTGAQWHECLHPQDMLMVDEKWKEAQKSQKGFDCECRLKHAQTGEYRWHLLRVVPEFANTLSSLVCWIGAATDIHDQKMNQQELLLAKKLADAASETKSNFLANMSHEIRTPLGIILGFSELLIDPRTSAQEKTEAISVIRRNGDQLSKIIDEILDLSKVEAGKMDIEITETSLVDLLHNVKALMSLPAKDKNLSLEFKAAGPIPTKILSNSTRLQQILINLIGNGIKFSPQGGLVITTSYKAATADQPAYVYFRVKDSGPGLTGKQIESLFQPFTQVDTSMTRKHGGTGLGLAFSKRLANALGGDIVVHESHPGEGCEFIVHIPAGQLESVTFVENLENGRVLQDPRMKTTVPLKGVQVLLVEDSLDNQYLVSRFLDMAGATIEVANNGIEGVAKATAGAHDIVLMDIQMPELDGYGAITQLRQSGFKKPIIALTAHGMVEDRVRCLDVGANDHLTKPVNRLSLIENIQRILNEGGGKKAIADIHPSISQEVVG